MQLKRIFVKNLFGNFDHEIHLNSEDKVTIITAPNGYGKTIILKILDSILNRKLQFITTLEFDEIELDFDDDVLNIKKTDSDLKGLILTMNGDDDNSFLSSTKALEKNKSGIKLNQIEYHISHLDRVAHTEWFDNYNGDIIDLDEVINRYSDSILELGDDFSDLYPDWFEKLTSSMNSHFVQDQRLILRNALQHPRRVHHSRKTTIDSIEKYSKELASEISRRNSEYSEISKTLDGSLPTRLLSRNNKIEIYEESSLKKKLNNLRDKNKRLKKQGLLTADFQFIPEIEKISAEDIRVLSLYVQDNSEKLSVYDELLTKIELFTEILNAKGLAFKKVSVEPQKGFVFKSTKDKPLELTQLSSGEQHEVVLLYELIFKAKDNDLILIDEPEISLHIAWQKDFLSDLKKIIDLRSVMVIIATHSPQIIDNNWDLTVDLEDGQ